ncbi:Histone-lysine N-methyltransferase SETMAR [Eumeta japonica]|uniref:Histone-lysine N-methyltransferase SETMAR n=1 Tax=Eumeta variegata TaxID=151549 RepID=A0A4C1Z5T9_EUMVA|nr:Histone-lysine N-methyltransferase SETMAR [Eumeta japonica]
MELTRKNFRALIVYDFKCSLYPKDCTARLQNAFGRETPHLSTVRRWCAKFDRGRVSFHDEVRKVRPSTAITEGNVAALRPRDPAILKIRRETRFGIKMRAQIGTKDESLVSLLHDKLQRTTGII